jgi:phosphoribosylamine--glycine ligase
MNILIIGQGGREHALAWKVKQSQLCDDLFIAPGNGGTSLVGHNLDIQSTDFEEILNGIRAHQIELVVVGPEAPLAAGLVDFLNTQIPDLQVIGPRKSGAQLESSKAFSKAFMMRHNIPTAKYAVVTSNDIEMGESYIDEMDVPIVLKADGLAAGKGVIICQSHQEAKSTLEKMLNGQFGEASQKVVIEEFLRGREYSVFILTDGRDYFLLPEAKDYKRVGEGDNGPNTGGMGAVSPVSYVDDKLWDKTIKQIIQPTLSGLRKEQIPYNGIIFFGLIEVRGQPYVIEYNCRLGDPETEVVIPRITTDLVQHFLSVCRHSIATDKMTVSSQACATVMMVSGGYPGSYEKGKTIEGLDSKSDSMIFHAGTVSEGEVFKTHGGRVLAVSSMADSAERAIQQSYQRLKQISFEKQYFRTDIGFDL